MTTDTFVDLKVSPAVAYAEYIRIEVRRRKKSHKTPTSERDSLADGHHFVIAVPLISYIEWKCDEWKMCDVFCFGIDQHTLKQAPPEKTNKKNPNAIQYEDCDDCSPNIE